MNVTYPTTLETIEQTSERIRRVIEAHNHGRDLKPGARRLRAAALCDLHTMRAQQFEEMDLGRVPADMVRDLAMAVSQAALKDRDSTKFWRAEAERR